MSEKIKVAIIGCGTIATSAHMPGYQANADIAEVKYFCDIIPERAQKLRDAYGSGEVVVDYHDILDDPEITCVSVCTPNFAHAPIAIDFMKHGKHVLCEKPAAIDAAHAAEMLKASKETGMTLNIGVCNRFKNDVIKVQEIIESGELGEIYNVYCSFRAFRSIPGLGGPFTTKALAGGGALIDWGVHFLDLIMYCINQPKVKTVSSECYSILGKEMEGYTYLGMWAGPPDYNGTYDVEEYCTGLIRTEGPSITMNGAWAQNIFEENMFIEFMGSKGGIKLNYYGGFTIYGTKNGMLTETKIAQTANNMYNDEIRDFLIKAPQGIKTKANIENAIITSNLMEQIYESAKQHRELVVG